MATIYDYVKYYKDVSFDEVAFNDVDSLIFSELVYANFKRIIPRDKGKYILFSDAMRIFLKKHEANKKKEPRLIREVVQLIEFLSDAKRYANIKMYHYINEVDQEKQFCAVTLRFHNLVYVAYEGTDTSIIGWKEDFLLTSTFPVPSQRFAVAYLNETIGFFDNTVFVGGHSKGGNLAMTAAMLASARVRMKIKMVYNFDGPGFLKKEYDSPAYRRMERKLKMFVPENSTFGMLLLHTKNYQVVKSNGVGIWQHDGFTWELFGGIFIAGKQTSRSSTLEKSNVEFISSLKEEDRNTIIDTIFSVFEKLGIKDTTEIKVPKLNQAISLVKDVKNIDSDLRKKIITLIKIAIKGIS